MVAAQSGLGYMIQLNRLLLLSDRVVAGMIIIGLVGYLMNRAALLIGKVLTPWTRLNN
jgi:ABC-type nitrate/sulfonate/bicarbonate transport system permease component